MCNCSRLALQVYESCCCETNCVHDQFFFGNNSLGIAGKVISCCCETICVRDQVFPFNWKNNSIGIAEKVGDAPAQKKAFKGPVAPLMAPRHNQKTIFRKHMSVCSAMFGRKLYACFCQYITMMCLKCNHPLTSYGSDDTHLSLSCGKSRTDHLQWHRTGRMCTS